MMTKTIEPHDEQKLLVVTTTGEASFDAFRDLIGQLLAPPFVELNFDVIIDSRRLNLKSLTREEAEGLADLLAQHMDQMSHVKHALIIEGVLSFGIARLFDARNGVPRRS